MKKGFMSASQPSVDVALLVANSANGNCLSHSSLRRWLTLASVYPPGRAKYESVCPGPLHLGVQVGILVTDMSTRLGTVTAMSLTLDYQY